jgi:hypothetical protein
LGVLGKVESRIACAASQVSVERPVNTNLAFVEAHFSRRARANWIFHPGLRGTGLGQPPRYAPDVKVIQLDIAPEEIGHNKATDVALVGPRVGPQARPRTGSGKAIMAQMNAALAGRQWFHPKDTPWRQMITKKAEGNAAMIRPQIHDDETPANYYPPCAISLPECRRTRFSAPRAPARSISASPGFRKNSRLRPVS